LLLAALALALVSIYALLFHHNGDEKANRGAPVSKSTAETQPTTAPSSTAAGSSTATQTSSAPVVPQICAAGQLTITAATDKTSYSVGERPKVALVVTNKGPAPCVADLADRQIELRVLSGSARVWGSHDCAVEPGSSNETLPVGQQIRREVEWSGLSSQPGCVGVRQRVPAGNYTLTALLAGQQGKPANFSFTG
jgi:hypothetical protein